MPRRTLYNIQADAARLSEALIAASLTLETPLFHPDIDGSDGLSDNLDGVDSDEDEDFDPDDTSLAEALELEGFSWAEFARALSGTGSRGPYNTWVKSKDFFPTALQSPDRWFRHLFRVGRDTFDRLVALLAQNPIFQSTGRKPQRHVKYQLAAFLFRYGRLGTDSLDVAQKLGIGHGSVLLYCKRVVRAFRELRPRFLPWPGEARRMQTADTIESKSGFPSCVGACDGSLIRICEEPIVDGHVYVSRKKSYSTNIQTTVDETGRFTSYELGWPGSVPDSRVFKNSHIWTHRHHYFGIGEYILVDKGYMSTLWTVRPFDEAEIGRASENDKKRMREFNQRLSSIRIISEHAYGQLKGRFPGLKAAGQHQEIDDLYKAIEALLVLHNICKDWKDRPEDIPDFDPKELDDGDEDEPEEDADEAPMIPHNDANIPPYETDDWLKTQGYAKRRMLLDYLFPL